MCSIIYRSSNDSMILKSGFLSRFQVYQNYGNLMYPNTFFLRQYGFLSYSKCSYSLIYWPRIYVESTNEGN